MESKKKEKNEDGKDEDIKRRKGIKREKEEIKEETRRSVEHRTCALMVLG